MELFESTVLGFIPGAFWLWFLRRKDDHEPEPWRLVILVFAAGTLSAFLVVYSRGWLEDRLPLGDGVARTLTDAFLLTAPLEETAKMLAFAVAIAWHRELDEPLDGIIYGTAVGLGFASVENAFYVYRATDGGAQLLFVRGFTSTLTHVTASGAMGFLFGLMRFSRWHKKLWLAGLGLLLAVVSHGAYNWFLSVNLAWVSLLVLLPAMLVYLGRRIDWARRQSPKYHPPAG